MGKKNRSKTQDRSVKSLMRLAKTLNVRYQRVCRLSHRGIIPKPHQGRYNVTEARKAIREHEAVTPGGSPSRFSTEWHERLKRAEALRAEMELDRLKGELIPLKDHVNEVVTRETELRDRLFVLPDQLGSLLEGRSRKEIQEIVYEHLCDAWKDFASGKTRRNQSREGS